MARWRRGARLAHGIGQGIENLGAHLMRQQTQDRYDERQQKNAEAILDRQQTMLKEQELSKILDAVRAGTLDPEQAVASAAQLFPDRSFDAAALEGVTPGPRRRMQPMVERITDATSLPNVPTDESILYAGKTPQSFDAAFAGPMSEGEEAVAGFRPQERGVMLDALRQGAARRRSFLDEPKQIEAENPETGAKELRATSLGQLVNGPLAIGPTAPQKGKLKGDEETALLNAAGAARAEQVGREATARNKADYSPDAIKGAASKAGAERRAQLQAELAQYGITGQQQTAAMQLADDFFTQSKDYYVKANSVKNIASMAQRIREARNRGEDSPASHIGLVFNFMKLQDPTSTVREGEQAQAANAGGVEDRVRNLYNKILLGGRLSDEQVNDFLGTAGAQYQAELGDQRARIQTFTERANTLRVPASLVVREPDPSLLNIGETSFDRLNRRGGQ